VTEHILLPKASLKLLDAAEDAAMGKIMGMSGGYHMYIGAIWKGGSPKNLYYWIVNSGSSYFRIFFRKSLSLSLAIYIYTRNAWAGLCPSVAA
jgi:hypothetical protein